MYIHIHGKIVQYDIDTFHAREILVTHTQINTHTDGPGF